MVDSYCSCEGSLLASGSADCTVKIWDVATSSKVSKSEEKYVYRNSNWIKLNIGSSSYDFAIIILRFFLPAKVEAGID